jgi:hypothetical protein
MGAAFNPFEDLVNLCWEEEPFSPSFMEAFIPFGEAFKASNSFKPSKPIRVAFNPFKAFGVFKAGVEIM